MIGRMFYSKARRGFSLVELLIVIVIIAIIAGFSVPAVQSVLQSSSVTQGGSILADQMSLARRHAVSNNRAVQVRFYRYADPEAPGEKAGDPSTGRFRAVQFFERTTGGVWIPASKVVTLPNTTEFTDYKHLSTILSEETGKRLIPMAKVATDPNNHVELPRNVKFNYDYWWFQFNASGSTDLRATETETNANSEKMRWHLTVISAKDESVAENGGVPPNYFCWMVDPVTGVAKTYVPGVK